MIKGDREDYIDKYTYIAIIYVYLITVIAFMLALHTNSLLGIINIFGGYVLLATLPPIVLSFLLNLQDKKGGKIGRKCNKLR